MKAFLREDLLLVLHWLRLLSVQQFASRPKREKVEWLLGLSYG